MTNKKEYWEQRQNTQVRAPRWLFIGQGTLGKSIYLSLNFCKSQLITPSLLPCVFMMKLSLTKMLLRQSGNVQLLVLVDIAWKKKAVSKV